MPFGAVKFVPDAIAAVIENVAGQQGFGIGSFR